MDAPNQEKPQKKETYGDPIKFRLASEFWRIVDELQPKTLAALEFVTESHNIDDRWRETIDELGMGTLELKYSILGFCSLLTKEDSESIRDYDVCYKLAISRKDRLEVQRGVMEGRAELYAKARLALEDRAIALFFQTMDIRAIAFKNNMWDFNRRPETQRHGVRVDNQ
jgi:hypothetical protein